MILYMKINTTVLFTTIDMSKSTTTDTITTDYKHIGGGGDSWYML